MSAQIISTSFANIVISKNSDYTLKHYSGVDNIPHFCLKIRHNNGFSWYGVKVLPHLGWQKPANPHLLAGMVKDRITAAIMQITDTVEIMTDLDRLAIEIIDVAVNHKNSVLVGDDQDEVIIAHLPNNVELTVFKAEIPSYLQTYGGYGFEARIGQNVYPGFIYHRGIILPNYLTPEDCAEWAEGHLNTAFGRHCEDIRITSVFEVARNRTKRGSNVNQSAHH